MEAQSKARVGVRVRVGVRFIQVGNVEAQPKAHSRTLPLVLIPTLLAHPVVIPIRVKEPISAYNRSITVATYW